MISLYRTALIMALDCLKRSGMRQVLSFNASVDVTPPIPAIRTGSALIRPSEPKINAQSQPLRLEPTGDNPI